ncbi:S41 family peptidase [Nannocystis bainbridge]|uniref:S41 family peptidase n=1 Tax=Nannocystis bainbridge TaxID=2995303 RepID=A0ABT5DZF0_9BACT|nr:S41 family peptidase [Nannocystis bainbridge]MDC0719002.1 S41 family peptidase [Nannocystis bainbridge]
MLLAALGVLACDDTCPEEHVPSATLSYACGPTAIGGVPLANGSFEARPDPLAGWSLLDADGTARELLPGLDGCAAIALSAPPDGFPRDARLTRLVPTDDLRGQRVRLFAYARVERQTGASPVLELRARVGEHQRVVDGAAIRLDDHRWALRDLVFDVPVDADHLDLTVRLGGATRVELDGVTLERVGPACPGCEPPAPLTARELDNLLAYTWLLRHVRSFYPGDEAGGARWNRLALAGVQAALRAESPAALAAALERAFQPRAPLLRVGLGAPDLTPIARPDAAERALVWRHGPTSERVDRSWLLEHVPEDTPVPDPAVRHPIALGRGLVATMPFAVWAAAASLPPPSRPDLPLARPPEFSPDLADRLTRLTAIALLGAHMTQFSPHVARSSAAWEHVLRDSFSRAAVARDRFGLREVVWQLLAAVGDTAGQVHVDNDVELGHRLALRWTWLEGQVVITAVDPARAPDLRVGDVVLALDGVAIAETLADARATAPGASEQRRTLWALSRLARGQTGVPRQLVVRGVDGTAREVAVATVPVALAPQLHVGPGVRELAPGVLYLDLSGLELADLPAARLARADAAVLDLRGGVGDPLARHLLAPQTVVDRHTTWPGGQHAWDELRQLSHADPPAWPARLAILVDAGATRNVEPVADALRARHGALLVGSDTAGGSFDGQPFRLPGGLVVSFTRAAQARASGGDPYTPLTPDVAVSSTIAGVRAGRDEVLGRALAELQRPR